MKIIYDGIVYQVYGKQPVGGVSRYFFNLISRLPKQFYPTLITCKSGNKDFPNHPNLKMHFYQTFRPGRLSSWLGKYYFRTVSGLIDFDIAHPTYYSLLTRKEIKDYRCPVVITVWDMIHELFANRLDYNGQLAEEKRKAIQAAQKIICISENTKKDLLERYKISENKVKVTYLASDIDARLAYGSERVPSQPYYLYVGSRQCYKNFDSLLFAFAKAISVQPDILLGVVGAPFSAAEKEQIAELKLSARIQCYGYVSDRHLAKLYRCSVAFVYPSLYEGFGIPPLEAMSCGTPVVASNCSSIPEVVGDAGLLFNPRAIDDLTDILLMLLDSPAQRDLLIAKGYERSKFFSWDQTAEQTVNIYRSVSD